MSRRINTKSQEPSQGQVVVEGDGEGTLSLALKRAQESTSLELRGQLDSVISKVKTSKLKLREKAGLLAQLVKAHETLTKTERMTAGVSGKEGHTTVNAGVIVLPQKADASDWHEMASQEVERAKAGTLPEGPTGG